MSQEKIINELEQVDDSEIMLNESEFEKEFEKLTSAYNVRYYEREVFDDLCTQFRPTLQKAYALTYILDSKNKARFTREYCKIFFKGVSRCRKEARKKRRAERKKRRAERKKRLKAQKLL